MPSASLVRYRSPNRNNNVTANNARHMTPAAARATLRNTRVSTLAKKGQRGLVIFYLLLVSSLAPQVEGYIPWQTMEALRNRSPSAPLLTNAQKSAASSAAKQGAVIAASYTGGAAGATAVLLAQIRADPMIQYALLLSGIAIFVYRLLSMKMAANNRRMQTLKLQHETKEKERNRQHQLAIANRQQAMLGQMMIQQQQMIPNLVMAIMQGRDPSLAQIAGI